MSPKSGLTPFFRPRIYFVPMGHNAQRDEENARTDSSSKKIWIDRFAVSKKMTGAL
jgi:hypothetical protein